MYDKINKKKRKKENKSVIPVIIHSGRIQKKNKKSCLTFIYSFFVFFFHTVSQKYGRK